MKSTIRKLIVYTTIILMNLSIFHSVSHAAIIDTNTVINYENRKIMLDKAGRFLIQDNVTRTLLDLGVVRQMVLKRVAMLNDSELLQLSEKIDQAPAGAGVVEVVGIVFIILIILELVGVTDIFKKL